MNIREQLEKLIRDTWDKKPLEALRVQAEREKTGIAFDSIREKDGKRLIIVLCVTGIDQIARIENALDLAEDTLSANWFTVSLAQLAVRAVRNGCGLQLGSLRDAFNRRSALLLIAADPDSVTKIEVSFDLPE